MSEKTKSTLCLIAIAVLVATAQTMDYNDQVQQEQDRVPKAVMVAWHTEVTK